MADRNIRFIPKRTSVPGRIPTGTTGTESNFIKQGELALNTADHKLFSYDGSSVFEIGSAFTGGTILGNLVAPSITASTSFYSGSTELGSLLTSSFARISHTHPITEIIGLQTYLNNKADLSGATFTGNVRVPILTATTLYSGSTNIQNIFQEIGHDYVKHVITVGKTGATFSTIGSALSSITDNSTSNRYIIQVAPGFYVEDTLVLKQFVDIQGLSYNTVTVEVDSPNKDVIILAPNTTIENLRLQGSTSTGQTIFNIISDFTPLQSSTITNCTIGDTDIILKSSLNINEYALMGIVGLSTTYGTSFNHGFDISGSGNTVVSLSETKMSINGPTIDFINLRGLNNRVIMTHSAVLVQTMAGASLECFAKIYDGSTLDIISVGVDGADVGFFNENNGSGAYMRINDYSSINSTYDIIVNHPDTIGNFRGAITKDKVIINSNNNTFALNYIEPLGGSVITGNLFFGSSNDELIKVNKLFFETPTMGRLNGGNISFVSGQTISVSSGSGYLLNDSTNIYQFIEWSAGTVSASTNSVKYVTIDEHGAIVLANNFPNNINKIVLGKIISDGSGIVSINNTPINAVHYNNNFDNRLREAEGSVYVSGSIVNENVTPFKIDISSGSYYFSTKKFIPSGGTAITFTKVYRSSTPGQHIYITGDTVPNTQYDDNSGVLANVPSGKYIKHALYCNGEGVDEKYFLVYGQEIFNSSIEATVGNLPSPPIGFDESIVRISSLVLSESGSSITSIIDQRPLNSSSSAAATSVTAHGNLTGLLNDDHPQYIRTDGGRILTGTFNLGGNDIISAGTINGISLNSHASRHLPNGLDPLTTATPISIGMSNNIGTANSFSRSDHRHAHGEQTGGTAHSAATQSVAGFMSALDKIFLDSVPNLLNNKADLSGATFFGGIYSPFVSATTITATTYYSGSTLLDSLFARTVHTHVISGVTGLQTHLNNKADLSGATFNGNVYAPSVSASTIAVSMVTASTVTSSTIAASTYYSGGTLVDSLFARTVHNHVINDVTGLQTHLDNKSDLSGATFSGDVIVPGLYGTSITGSTLYSGNTNLSSIINSIVTGTTIDYIKIDGTSSPTTGNIKEGEALGLSWGASGNTFIQGYGDEDISNLIFLQAQDTSGSTGSVQITTQLVDIQAKSASLGNGNNAFVIEESIDGASIINNGRYSTFKNDLLTNNRIYNLPDESGEFLLGTTVKYRTTAALTATYNNGASGVGAVLSGTTNVVLPTIDGITAANQNVGDRILVMNQATASQNGIYVLTSKGVNGISPWILTRASDADTGEKIYKKIIKVELGSANNSSTVINSNTTSITVGTTAINYIVHGGFLVGTGLNLTNKTISIPNNTISRAQLSNGVATSIIGRSVNSTGAVADIQATADGQFLKRAGGVLSFTSLTISDVAGLQTQLDNEANLSGATFSGGIFAPTISATTFYSGSTLLDSLFARTVHNHVISDVTGLQTHLNNKADLSGATFSGGVYSPSVSAVTYYSGSTLLDSLFARTVHTHVINDVTGLQTHLNNKADLSGATLTGNFFNSSTGFFQVSTGTTVQRPVIGITGMLRYNSTLGKFEGYEVATWKEISTHWITTGTSVSYTGGNTLIGGLVDIPAYKLQVTGNTLLSGNFSVTGNTLLSGNTSINGNVIITGNTLISGNLIVTGESNTLIVSSGSTVQRPTGTNGMIRYNSTNGVFEGYERNSWIELGNIQYVQFSLLGQINNSTASFWYAKDESGVTGAYRSVDTGNGISANNVDPWLAPYNGRIIGAVVFCKGLGVANGSPSGPFTYRALVYNVGNGGSQTTGMTTLDFIFPTGTTVGAYNSSVATYASTEYITTSAVTFNRGQNIGLVWSPVGGGAAGSITVQEGTRLTLIVQKTL